MRSNSRKEKNRCGSRANPSVLSQEQALSKAIAVFQEGGQKQAEELCRKILAQAPKHAETLHALAVMLCHRGQHLEAIDLFRAAILVDPTRGVYHFNLGNACKDSDQMEQAVSCYEQAIVLQPGHIDSLNNLGTVLHCQGKFAEAVSVYRKILDIKPDHAEALYNLGNSLQSQRQIHEAVISYQAALLAKANFPEVYNQLGKIFNEQGKAEAAINCFRHALYLDPTCAEYYVNLAQVLREQKQLDEAMSCYQRVLELAPDMAIAYNNLGVILNNKKRYQEAIDHYAQALRLQPDLAIAYVNLGKTLVKTGNIDEAADACLKALESSPELSDAYMLLAELFFMNPNDEVFDAYADAIISERDPLETDRNWLNIQRAIRTWLKGDTEKCAEYLRASASIQHQVPADRFEKSRLAFYCLIRKLTDHRAISPHLYGKENYPPAYIIGDSHCLSFANLPVRMNGTFFTTRARLVMGCKAYHLGQADNNSYKETLLRNIGRLTNGSIAIFSFGEIDCRVSEGIYLAWLKKNRDLPLAEMVEQTVNGYVDFLFRATQGKDLKIMLLGVPAPIKDAVILTPIAELQNFMSIPRLWNRYLQDAACRYGWTCLDIYSLTVSPTDADGFSPGGYHIDEHHLYPEVFPLLLESVLGDGLRVAL